MILLTQLMLLLLQAALTGQTAIIQVTNGGRLGNWGEWETCPPGHIAGAFQTKTEQKQGVFVDDTALNGIALHCAKPGSREVSRVITSTVGGWGTWGPIVWCPSGYIVRFRLKVEPYHLFNDNTAANKIEFLCSDFTMWEQGLDWGWYGDWSGVSRKGFSGIKTRVQSNQGPMRDDTALNNVQFLSSEH